MWIKKLIFQHVKSQSSRNDIYGRAFPLVSIIGTDIFPSKRVKTRFSTKQNNT